MTAAQSQEQKYVNAAGRMLSGMILLFLLHAGATAMLAFVTGAVVLMLNREDDPAHVLACIATGLYAGTWAWGEHYCTNAQMRFLIPVTQIF